MAFRRAIELYEVYLVEFTVIVSKRRIMTFIMFFYICLKLIKLALTN